jgi:hypothetical protein
VDYLSPAGDGPDNAAIQWRSDWPLMAVTMTLDEVVSSLAWVWINGEMYEVASEAMLMNEQARRWAEIDLPLLTGRGDSDSERSKI